MKNAHTRGMSGGEVSARIVCAAIRNVESGLVLAGARHFDTVMVCVVRYLKEREHLFDWEQGFIDQFGNFLTRQEAWTVAEAAGQIDIERNGGEHSRGTLYSEGLY